MIGLLAYLALVVVIPALLLGHQGQDFPLARACRCALAWRPQGRSRVSRVLRGAPEPAHARTAVSVPSWARTDEEAA